MPRAHELVEDLLLCYKERRPAFIWGPPGVGKSDIAAQIAAKLGIALIDFRLAMRDPTDIKGFPMPDQATKTMKFFRDGELPKSGAGILFGDEMNSAPQATQAAFMQLTLPGHDGKFRIGDYVLPEGYWILGAGNRETDRGVVHRMPTPLSNRMTHFELEVHHEDWVDWAYTAKIDPLDIGFIRFRTNLLLDFKAASNDRAFPTPRSWVAAFNLRKKAANEASALRLVRGTVGEGAAGEYFAYRKTAADMPKIEDIKKAPTTTRVPENLGVLYAVVTQLSMATTVANFPTFMQYVTRMPAEFQAVYVRDVIAREPKIKQDKALIDFALKNRDLIV